MVVIGELIEEIDPFTNEAIYI